MSSQGMSPVMTFFFFFLPKSSQRFVNFFAFPSYRFYSACCAALSATLSALCWLFLYILLWAHNSADVNCFKKGGTIEAIAFLICLAEMNGRFVHMLQTAHSFLHVWLRASPTPIFFFCGKKKMRPYMRVSLPSDCHKNVQGFWSFWWRRTMSGDWACFEHDWRFSAECRWPWTLGLCLSWTCMDHYCHHQCFFITGNKVLLTFNVYEEKVIRDHSTYTW